MESKIGASQNNDTILHQFNYVSNKLKKIINNIYQYKQSLNNFIFKIHEKIFLNFIKRDAKIVLSRIFF